MKHVTLLASGLLAALAGCAAEHKEVSRHPSPDQKLVAVLMESVTGQGSGSLRDEIYLNDQGVPLSLDTPVFSGIGCDGLSFAWVNDYTLQIRYQTTCAITHFTNRWDRPSNIAAGRPHPIEIILVRG